MKLLVFYSDVDALKYNELRQKGRQITTRKLHLNKACISNTLRKHAYLNIFKISPPKNENFQIKKSDIFHISAQNIDCGHSLEPPRRGGSNEYPHSMSLSRNKKIMSTPLNPNFTI